MTFFDTKLLLLTAAFATGFGCNTGNIAAFANRLKQVRTTLDLGLQQPGDAALVDIEYPDPARTRPDRRQTSDIKLELASAGADIDATIRAPDASEVQGGGTLFEARVLLVLSGQIIRSAYAVCGPWVSDVSVCSASCEGGSFALRRVSSSQGVSLRFLIGANLRSRDEDASAGFSLLGCGADERRETWRL